MSLNETPLPVKAVIDPRMEIDLKKEYLVVRGPSFNGFQSFAATNVSNSSIQITCNPPNSNIAVARLALKRFTFSWQVSGVNTSGGVLLNAGYYGPRAMPLTCVTQSETINIGSDTFTQAPVQQYWRALLRYRNDFMDRFGAMSMAPTMLDQFQDYLEGVGTVRNPLAAYGDNSYEQTRAGYVGFTIDPQLPGNTVATGTLSTIEPVLMSPFCWGEKANSYCAFVGVETMAYSATLGNLSRILSLVQGQGAPLGQIVLGDPVVNVTAASILFNYLTPSSVQTIPRNLETSYFSVNSYPTRSLVPVASGASIQMVLNSIQIAGVPKRIYLFAKADDSQETAFTSDTYLSLPQNANPLTITWQSQPVMSQATTQDLFNISVKNGCNLSYSQYVDRIGSVLALDFGTDVGLAANLAAGSIGNFQLSVTCSFVNTSAQSILPTFYCVVVTEGVVTIRDNVVSHKTSVLSPSDVLDAQQLPSGSYTRNEEIYGGSWKSVQRFMGKVGKFIRDKHLVSTGLSLIPDPRAQLASKAARMIGLGYSGGGSSGGALDDYGAALDDYGGSLSPAAEEIQKPKPAPKMSASKAKTGMNLSMLA